MPLGEDGSAGGLPEGGVEVAAGGLSAEAGGVSPVGEVDDASLGGG